MAMKSPMERHVRVGLTEEIKSRFIVELKNNRGVGCAQIRTCLCVLTADESPQMETNLFCSPTLDSKTSPSCGHVQQ